MIFSSLVACGPAVSDETSGSGSSSGSSGPPPETTASSQTSTGEAESSTTGADCTPYDDEPASAEAVLQVHNVGDAAVLLEINCGWDFLRLRNIMEWAWPGPFCTDTCENQRQYGCSLCDGCAEGAFLVIQPGASFDFMWPGMLFETVTPPLACSGEYGFCEGSTCPMQRDPVGAGSVEVSVATVLQADCEALAADPALCACPDAQETCDTTVDLTEQPSQTTATTRFAPGSDTVVVIEVGP